MRFSTALVILLASVAAVPSIAQDSSTWLLGAGKADITGPAVGVQMWGFVREDQIAEGIHLRQWSRAFVIADRASGRRLAFVTADLGSITHFIHLAVVEKLQARYNDAYALENTIITATHTHAGPAGYWHYGVTSPLGGAFYQAHFDAIVDGIVASIVQAHDNLAPGSIVIGRGVVEDAGAQRSAPAYLNNPAEERARYTSDTDKEMTLMKFVCGGREIGVLNWFASHPTAMTYNNKLISGDHKGYASWAMEQEIGAGFVAAFAQTNCGDVTPNLNLDNTGPGADDFETTKIIGERQLEVAKELFETSREPLSGPIDYRFSYADFRYLPVDQAYTGVPGATTCPSAYGYAFAAGSTEDGGGHPMFREGMKVQNAMIDNLVKQQFEVPPPSEQCRTCHGAKAILFATGETDPPAYTQIVPITLARIGQLALVCVPAEFTTMAGRRLRDTVQAAFGDGIRYIVIAGYANDYTGYVTTPEEYETQQYEGGHTLYGPWTLPAYQQEFTRLARAMRTGEPVEPGPAPRDFRSTIESTPLWDATADRVRNKEEVITEPDKGYSTGQTVRAVFRSADPRAHYSASQAYVEVQRQSGDEWATVDTDAGWSTKIRWTSAVDSGEMQAEVSWEIPEYTAPAIYRLVYRGNSAAGPFEAATSPFAVAVVNDPGYLR